MKIVIVHLFYDLLNLYGESGNVLSLKNCLEKQGIDVEIKNISLNDTFDLSNADIIYLGSGTESNKLIALNYLMQYKEEIHQAYKCNKFFLSTGNSIELFGKTLLYNNETIDCINLFDFKTTKSSSRIVSECVFNYENTYEKVLGFENHENEMSNTSNPLFTVEQAFGYNRLSKVEGIHENNFYGTYLIGPLLSRNPVFLEYFVRQLVLNKDKNFEFKSFDLEIEKKAHDNYIKKYS